MLEISFSDANIIRSTCKRTAYIINTTHTNYVTTVKRTKGRVQEGKYNLVSSCKFDLNLESKLSRGSSLFFVTTTKYSSLI